MAGLLIGNLDGSATDEELRDLQPRLNELFWKNRKLKVSVLELRQDPGAH